ncbi:MAG: TIGR02281 family clan AA aspartic protease [Dokdonella sp.]|nr:MAG: TIGR02281 family clan AA aspartic protease [Dokdonella sp.]
MGVERCGRSSEQCQVSLVAGLALFVVTTATSTFAQEVGLAGVFPGKALLTIGGGAMRTVAVGTTTDGVKLVAVSNDTATVEVGGKKRILSVGQNVVSSSLAGAESARAVLTADSGGHFLTTGNINGTSVRFLVDTGASTIALSAGEARRIGIDSGKGESRGFHTPNGLVTARVVRLDSVRVGDIVVNRVEAAVVPQEMPVVLLGLSFLNHLDMQREGQTMTLKRRD